LERAKILDRGRLSLMVVSSPRGGYTYSGSPEMGPLRQKEALRVLPPSSASPSILISTYFAVGLVERLEGPVGHS
jgi:hypothetical protein